MNLLQLPAFTLTLKIILFTTIPALVAACDSGSELGKCPSGDTATQEQAGYDAWVEDCDRCHASTASSRNGAPSSVLTDDLSYVSSNKEILWGEIDSNSMPTDVSLSDSIKEDIRVWLACGSKSQTELDEAAAEEEADNENGSENDGTQSGT